MLSSNDSALLDSVTSLKKSERMPVLFLATAAP